LRVAGLCAISALLSLVVPAAASAAREPEHAAGHYIVMYDNSVASSESTGETEQREQRDGFRADVEFRRAVRGFAARLDRRQVERLQADPEVASVTPDRVVHALGAVAPGETVPTGVRRLGAGTASTARGASSVNVAVIDTGIDQTHPELNTAGGKNCVGSGAPNDDNGHGTHVAGTIGARNSGSGVVGVAPGTKLFAAKVLDASGSGLSSQVICGIDWVTSTRTDSDPTNDISVANMSLGGVGSPVSDCATTTDPEHKAICNSVAAGVTYVVAAGNDGWDFDYASAPDTPAAFGEVLTVTAVSDADGAGGAAGGAPSCRTGEVDDRYASFSNWAATSAGQAHTIAGPGVCIQSTWMNGGYNTISGTSMATPHLAGAVALCLGENGASGPCTGLTPAQIVAKMRNDAQAYTTAHPSFGFTGDPLHAVSGRYYGFLAYAGSDPGSTPPPPPPPPAGTPVSATPGSGTITSGTLRSGGLASLGAADSNYLQINSTTSGTRATDWYGSFSGVPSTLTDLKVTYRGRNSASCTQAVSIYRWTGTPGWVTLSSRSVGTTEVTLADLLPPGGAAQYVSSGGELRVRIRCTRSANFIAQANQLKIAYTNP
jgi:subtilisin family serine protease